MYAIEMRTLADVVRDARNALGMTQEELDEAIGKSPGYIGQLEIGRVKRPQPKTLRALSEVLGVSLEDFGVATGQLDTQKQDVQAAIERINQLSTEGERLAVFRTLPPLVRRGIRRLTADFLSAASEEVLESDGQPEDRLDL